MRRRRRAKDIVIAALFIIAVAALAALLQTLNSRDLTGPARVIDGDTITVEGTRVRLRGIDAPEIGQQCMGGDGIAHPCGRLAASYLETLIGGDSVECSGHDTDRYGRFLGVCHETGNRQGASLNAAMVENGWAIAYGDHGRLEREAQAERRGLWAWEFDRPADWRRQKAALDEGAVPRAGLGAAIRRFRAFVGWGGHHE